MLFDHHSLTRFLAGHARRLSRTAARLAIAAALVPVSGLVLEQQLAASDFEGQSSIEDTGGGHFVRIGLHKSVVIKLPARAKDVIVGDPEIVDAVVRNKNTAYLFARKVGQTNIFFFDAAGHQIMNIDLEVALDSKALQKLVGRTLPGSRITVDTINGSVVLNGTAANAVEAKIAEDLAIKFAEDPAKVVNAIKISGGDQVMLKVRVVEVQRSVLKSLGIDLSVAADFGKLGIAAATANPILGATATSTISYSGSDFSFDAAISAMEEDGVLHTLAEPTLTAISGASATFHAGGELPYRTCSTSTAGLRECTVTFRPVGVSLDFTPIVLTEGRISLQVRTEVSERGSEVVDTLPTIDTREANTIVELPSGGSMMMAGLIKTVSQQEINGTPGLKDLPVIGALFRSRQFQKKETEMVVIVTPYIVNPVNERQLATPADNFREATDRQTIMFGRLNQVYGTPGRHPEGVYHGNVGFIIE